MKAWLQKQFGHLAAMVLYVLLFHVDLFSSSVKRGCYGFLTCPILYLVQVSSIICNNGENQCQFSKRKMIRKSFREYFSICILQWHISKSSYPETKVKKKKKKPMRIQSYSGGKSSFTTLPSYPFVPPHPLWSASISLISEGFRLKASMAYFLKISSIL